MNFAIISPTFPKFHTKIALPLILFSLLEVSFSSLIVAKMISAKSHGLQMSIYLKLKKSQGFCNDISAFSVDIT